MVVSADEEAAGATEQGAVGERAEQVLMKNEAGLPT
jgi:hypothetical protein